MERSGEVLLGRGVGFVVCIRAGMDEGLKEEVGGGEFSAVSTSNFYCHDGQL